MIVIVIFLLLLAVVIVPAVILPHPGTGVEVLVGVNVMVGVKDGVNVNVAVGVFVGVSVGVPVGSGVNVIRPPGVSVAVGVLDGPVGIIVTVSVGTAVDGLVAVAVWNTPVVGTTLLPEFKSRIPNIVRALDEVIGRELIGSRVTMGLYVDVTVTTTRSGSGKVLT